MNVNKNMTYMGSSSPFLSSYLRNMCSVPQARFHFTGQCEFEKHVYSSFKCSIFSLNYFENQP